MRGKWRLLKLHASLTAVTHLFEGPFSPEDPTLLGLLLVLLVLGPPFGHRTHIRTCAAPTRSAIQ